ncbi:MAG: hypothetical protein IPI65_13535 [Bacteroidetes bacterium]|nr:hypothetical protein [Bacteroidota bacterium]
MNILAYIIGIPIIAFTCFMCGWFIFNTFDDISGGRLEVSVDDPKWLSILIKFILTPILFVGLGFGLFYLLYLIGGYRLIERLFLN